MRRLQNASRRFALGSCPQATTEQAGNTRTATHRLPWNPTTFVSCSGRRSLHGHSAVKSSHITTAKLSCAQRCASNARGRKIAVRQPETKPYTLNLQCPPETKPYTLNLQCPNPGPLVTGGGCDIHRCLGISLGTRTVLTGAWEFHWVLGRC